ncbi:MAG TPA: hypothetical protein VMS81_08565 [Methanomicrobiales archaeon]|jgi:hypothetical protein|nr:hypothetical protein [Methanomicrobiales archaeon]
MSRNTIGIAILGLILVGAIALPVSAAQVNGKGLGKAEQIDPELKNDLWGVYAEYRLQVYDTRVEGANAAVTVLGNHGCPTGDLMTTVTAIGNERTALSDALTSHDRKALGEVNKQLTSLWKQFREQAKASVKDCSTRPVTSNPQVSETGASA